MHTQNLNETSQKSATSRLESAIAAADRLDGSLKAFVHRPSSYLNSAPVAETALSGVPVAVKDLIDTADMPTAYGSKIFEGHQPKKDAWIVQRLREVGATIFGKTVTTEFAWRDPGETVNPWNAAHSPGGSSSGSAAAVGAGIVDIAVGTQTVGSIIRPSAYCGAVGYKPTYGTIPIEGTNFFSPTLDHLGFITSNCYWAAVAHQLIVKGDTASNNSEQIDFHSSRKPKKLGIYRSSLWSHVSDDVKDNFDAVVRLIEANGIQCVDINLSLDIREIVTATNKIMFYDAKQNLYPKIKGELEKAGPWTHELIKEGEKVSKADYDDLRTLIGNMRMERDRPLDGLDAIISITSPTSPPVGLTKTGDASFCAPWSFLGLPALSIPSGLSSTLLPLGVQLIGRSHEDMQLIMIGQWLSGILPRLVCPNGQSNN